MKAGVKMSKDKEQKKVDLDETLPHQISSPDFKGTGMKMQAPFVNEHGVVIGDSLYDSSNSPLNNWSTDTDPEVMAGDEWVHPTNDIGWNTNMNRDLIEKKAPPKEGMLRHPTKDSGYGKD
ncbi:DUF3905 domain-containing protein [Fictibacillus sp. 7GRE50]|uniref:DUF3905 domain-containing protein n=2 Tax=unclassified Fictibacillus TaxID=2644029 RepID=UPI001E5FA4EC|nr:DUF3905 domain-containing protein [Fictibacillus sp. 7GRE50]